MWELGLENVQSSVLKSEVSGVSNPLVTDSFVLF